MQQIKLPFITEVPIPPPGPKPTHVPIEEAEELNATISKLEKENEELYLRLIQVTHERNELNFNLK